MNQPTKAKFQHYVAFNEYGGVAKRVPRLQMEFWLREFEKNRIPALGCWEFSRPPDDLESELIYVRLAPHCELDNVDNNWRSWLYTFIPERL